MSLWGLELGGRGIESESGARGFAAQVGGFFGGRDASGRIALGSERDVGCCHWKSGGDEDGGYRMGGGGCTEEYERPRGWHANIRVMKKQPAEKEKRAPGYYLIVPASCCAETLSDMDAFRPDLLY